ncbi:UNVERIFIED_CONTAM: hypothetical protein HDU68_004608, partial [Siphonaria sp. JEL0065]
YKGSRISTTNHSGSTNDSEGTDINGEVKAFMFKVGLRLNRTTSMWKTASMLGIPELDMLIILGGANSGTYTLTECSIKVMEKTTAAAKKSNEEILELIVGANKTSFLVEFPRKDLMEEFRGLRSKAAMYKNCGTESGRDNPHTTSQTGSMTAGIRGSVVTKRQPDADKASRKNSVR